MKNVNRRSKRRPGGRLVGSKVVSVSVKTGRIKVMS